MFRFLELELHNWDLWRAIRMPLDADVVLMTGPNGSGKTTLVDAIRQLLNASRLSSRRRLQHYLRHPNATGLIRAVVSNMGPSGAAPPFRRERITTPEVTLACALVPSGGGTPEKRFAILPGRSSLDELRRTLLESRDFYPPERYERALEYAGVTRSLMKVLAIEQGKTNLLFDLTPRQLLQWVLEMLGDQSILSRYREARRRYEETDRELSRQVLALHEAQANLSRIQREVRHLDEWEEARDKVADLEARLPAAELQGLLRHLAEATSKSRELQTKVRRGEAEKTELDERLLAAAAEEARTQAALDAARIEENDAKEAWGSATRAEAEAGLRVRQLEEMQREVETLLPGDLDALTKEAEEATRSLFRAEEEEKMAAERAATAARKVNRLAGGSLDYPDEVIRMVDELTAHGINSAILASNVEVIDPDLAESIEAALGDARYALLVSPSEEEVALRIAHAHGFPGPVYSGPVIDVGAEVSPLVLLPGAPAWLRAWLESVDLRTDGSWGDFRGVWVAKARERVLGATGREAAIKQAKEELAAADRGLMGVREALSAERMRHQSADARLNQERRRKELLVDLAVLPEAGARAREAKATLEAARQRLDQAASKREAANSTYMAAKHERLKAETEAGSASMRLAGERKALDEVIGELTEIHQEVGELIDRVAPDLRGKAERGELDGPDTVRADLVRAKDYLAGLGEPPPREIRVEERHFRANVEDLERHVAERRREAEEARSELAECRKRYLEVVAGTLQDYRRRAVDVARGADVVVEMQLPTLADDDRILDEAAIEVWFGFDGKEPLPLGDSSFSGGQQVIAGLILLIAMAETEGRGFFMLDEPFAHLSIDRIDDVGRFLRSTRSQFILTAPTTIDRAQLDPASLVIVLNKKRPDEQFAPVPIIASA